MSIECPYSRLRDNTYNYMSVHVKSQRLYLVQSSDVLGHYRHLVLSGDFEYDLRENGHSPNKIFDKIAFSS